MPKIKVNDIDLYYESHGSGQPLLFLEGLGYSTWMWFKQLDYFARYFNVIIFDNRGVGDSDKPDFPYSIEMMARDAAGLLQALHIDQAKVIGISMGGIIAQELTLSYPERVEKLVLGCTSFGGPNSIPMPADTLKALHSAVDLPLNEQLRQSMSTAFSPGYMKNNSLEIDSIIRWRMEKPTPRYAWQHQFNAVAGYNAEERLEKIEQPALVISGDEDKVLPVQNSYLIHEKISHSRLEIFPGAGHLFFIEQAKKFNQVVHSFLEEGTGKCM